MVVRRKLEDTQQVALRLPTEMIRRADAYAAALAKEHPGMIYTRTDALRIILAKHLPPLPPEDADEAAPPEPPPKSRKPKQRS